LNEKRRIRISKFLSLMLRHQPQHFGIRLDEEGWAGLEEVIEACRQNRIPVDKRDILTVVRLCDKQRFAVSADGTKIRANYGHSVKVKPTGDPMSPPEFLLHGTAGRFLPSILKEGLRRQKRQFVHLSTSPEIALQVGNRYGKPVLLKIAAREMERAGHVFYRASDGRIWLTDHVPPKYLSVEPVD
jgi:putative RNA 2'-phosphotransferase